MKNDKLGVVHIIFIHWLLQLFPIADMVLSNKLVLYDLEQQTIGWTEYNCEYYVVI